MERLPLRLAVLGPVQLWRDGAELDLGPAQRRSLFALLLGHVGGTVGLSEIVAALWGDAPPLSAVNVVHRHVGALRRLLEPGLAARAEGRWLLRGGGGYRLRVPDGALDLLRFREVAAGARAVDVAGAADEAVRGFLEALALWSGPVAADCPPRVRAHPVFTALDREYLAVVMEAADAALRCGEGERLLPHLRDAAVRHPLNEALHTRLVAVLAATGRRADAREAYDTVRVRLADELGVDAGPELQAAAREIGPAPDAAAPTPPAIASPNPPNQLPAALPVFAGRRAELDRLLGLLAPTLQAPRTVLISAVGGMAGIGKTTLVVRLAHEVADRFPDGQLYVNLRGFDPSGPPLPPEDALRGFLDALGVPPHRVPAGPDAQAALYRSLLAGRRMLVLLDNAHDVAQVRPLLPGAPGCLVLITSRNHLSGLIAAEGAHPLTLDVLTADDAREALVRRLGAERVDAEPAAVEEIITRTARLPLALAVVAAHAAVRPGFPLASIAGELREAHGSLDAFADGTDSATDVRAVFSWSRRSLSPAADRLFRLLALHPGPDVTAPAAASLAGLTSGQSGPLLAQLTRAHLVIEHLPGRYTFHDLLRTYATELVAVTEGDNDRRAAVHRTLDHYLRTAYAATVLFSPQPSLIALAPQADPTARPEPIADSAAALAWLTTEHRVLLGAVRQAAAEGFATHTWQLAWTLERFHERQGLWDDWLAAQHTALEAARRLPDPAGLLGSAHAHRGLGRAHSLLRHYDEALDHLHTALGLFEKLDDAVGRAHTHRSIGWVLTRQDRHIEALEDTRRALDLYRVAGHRRGRADALNAIGWFKAELGDHHAALAHGHEALALHQELGDRVSEAHTWDTLAYAHHHLGNHGRAVAGYRHALDLFREHSDPLNEAGSLDRLGDTHFAAGDLGAARRAWQQALDILTGLDPAWAERVRAKTTTTAHRTGTSPRRTATDVLRHTGPDVTG